MGSSAITNVLFGTFLVILTLVFLVVVARVAKRHFFPSENERERSEAMTELLLLQAELQKRASEEPGWEGGIRGPDPLDSGGE